ncbi:MAG: DUF6114 domain-containing protein [Candidatus Bathyarchaeota archaeon]
MGVAASFIAGINLIGIPDVAGLLAYCPFVSEAVAAGATESELLALCPFISEADVAGITAVDIQAWLAGFSTILYTGMAIGIIFGIIIIVGASMVYRNPLSKTGWGIAILVLSIISIVIGGGFILGFILGIIGGALILAWKPKTPTT